MEYKDYYKILGVEKNANQDDIKKAYRKLAMKHHPDHNPGDRKSEEKFKDINEAYQVLGDDQQRSHYDRLGSSYAQWQQTGGSENFNWNDWFARGAQGQNSTRTTRVDVEDLGDMFGGGFSDFFNMVFGGMRQDRPRTSGGARQASSRRSSEQTVQISFQEAYTGTERMVQVGSRRLRVKIPAGAKTGTRVRMANAASTQSAGSAGQADLYLVIHVTPDPQFELNGDNLSTEASIDLYTAVLGGQADVSTPEGKVLLTIPAGTQSGQMFRLTGRGMPNLRAPQQRGDLYVRVKVQIPRQISKKQQELFEQLKNS
jgi:curved DNA-binding protein